jgi:hypothetical protein
MALFAFAHRVKGADWYYKGEKLKHFLYIPFKAWSAILVFSALYPFTNAVFSGIISVLWLLAIMPGLGAYLGNIKQTHGLIEKGDQIWIVSVLDKLWDKLKLSENHKQTFYGWVGTSIRGGYYGLALAVPTTSLLPLIAGLSMPVWYYLGFVLEKKWPKTFVWDSHIGGWALGEWFYGAVLGLSVFLCL